MASTDGGGDAAGDAAPSDATIESASRDATSATADAAGDESNATTDAALDAISATTDAASDARDAGTKDTDASMADVADASPKMDASDGGCAANLLACGGTCVANDVHNCGACGHDCGALPHVTGPVQCLGTGACSFPASSCAPRWLHCAGSPDLGCETDANTAANCGACGSACQGTSQCVTGACQCPPSTPTYCRAPSGYAACADLSKDQDNCGRCGHGCQGGTCSAGVCTAVVLAPATPTAIAVDGVNVYWLDNNASVLKCGVGGCGKMPIVVASTFLAAGGGFVGEIAVDDTNVYWLGSASSFGPGHIMKWAKSGGSPVSLANVGNSSNLAVDAASAFVYWTDYNGTLGKVSVNGGPTIPFASPSDRPWGIGLFNGSVYWTGSFNGPQTGTVWTCPTTGCTSPLTSLASGQANPTSGPSRVVANATGVYWTQYGPIVKLSGGMTTVLAASGLDIAVDSTNLYWTDANTVQTCPLAGCTSATNIAILYSGSGVGNNYAIAIDATSIYWTDSGTSIMKIAKP